MIEINPKFHGRRCRVYTIDYGDLPLIGIVSVSQPNGAMILVDDRAVMRYSITHIEFDGCVRCPSEQ
jgi:hypothetical protein